MTTCGFSLMWDYRFCFQFLLIISYYESLEKCVIDNSILYSHGDDLFQECANRLLQSETCYVTFKSVKSISYVVIQDVNTILTIHT